MIENKTFDRISMRVHLVNAIAWAGGMIVITCTVPEFTFKTAPIMIAGFILEITLLIEAFRDLRTHKNQ